MSKSNGFRGHTIPSYPVTKSKHHNPSELPSVHLWNRDPDSLLLCRGAIQFAWTLPVSKQKVPPPGNCLSWVNLGWLVVLEMDTSPPKNEPPDTLLGPQDSQTAQQCSVWQEGKESSQLPTLMSALEFPPSWSFHYAEHRLALLVPGGWCTELAYRGTSSQFYPLSFFI